MFRSSLRVSTLLAFALLAAARLDAACSATGQPGTLPEIVARVEAERPRYLFVGESHANGPIKQFAVDLANALIGRGLDVGLYVEGFRVGCEPGDASCWSLARAFGGRAFQELLERSKAPVHALDPPGRSVRARRMAEIVGAGTEAVRVVLIGRSHVVYAQDPDAELRVYGGSQRYPDPGDVAESFPRESYLTFGLETTDEPAGAYALRTDGCAVDYVVSAPPSRDYFGRGEERAALEASSGAALLGDGTSEASIR